MRILNKNLEFKPFGRIIMLFEDNKRVIEEYGIDKQDLRDAYWHLQMDRERVYMGAGKVGIGSAMVMMLSHGFANPTGFLGLVISYGCAATGITALARDSLTEASYWRDELWKDNAVVAYAVRTKDKIYRPLDQETKAVKTPRGTSPA